jgi:multiple sugar transport system permease protein
VPVIRRARAVDRTRLRDREGFLAWAFLLPTVVYLTALVVAPFGLTVAFAFSRSTSAAPSYRFGGLRDFRRILGDHVFRRSLADTLALTGVVIVVVVLLGTVLAHVLLADLRFRRTVRVLVLLPWTTPVALSAISWRWLLGSPGSAADRLLRAASLLHGDGSPLTRTPSAAVAVATVHVWRLTPLAAVIMMAGLAAIPRGVRDAAHLDGAGFWRRLFGVTVPLTLPATAVAALVAAVATFADLAVVRVLTGGGPRDSTQVLSGLAYARGVEDGDVGGGAATALFLLPLFLAGVYLTARVVRRARGRS